MKVTRVKCTNPKLFEFGLFGTLIGSEHNEADPVRPGVLCDVRWLDWPDEVDEFDGAHLRVVSESAYQCEVAERRLDDR